MMRTAVLFQCICPIILATAVGGLAFLWPVLLRVWRLPQTLISQDSKDSDALRIGILGASFIARAAVVSAADKRKDVVVSAVAARDAERAKSYAFQFNIPAFHGGPTAYSDLLRRDDVDAVYIGLPTGLHLEWSLAALHAGKHVLLEKPAVLNANEAAKLVQEAKRSGRMVFEAAHYRYHPAAKRAKQIMSLDINEGGISPLRSVEVRFSMLDPKAWLRSFSPGDATLAERVKNFDRWWQPDQCWHILLSFAGDCCRAVPNLSMCSIATMCRHLPRYCVDMLLWSTGAVEVEVLTASESRYSLAATLKLQLRSAEINASVSMARDTLLLASFVKHLSSPVALPVSEALLFLQSFTARGWIPSPGAWRPPGRPRRRALPGWQAPHHR